MTLQVRKENNDPKTEVYDDMVLFVLADDAVKLLGKKASWKERFLLRGAVFFNVSEDHVRSLQLARIVTLRPVN